MPAATTLPQFPAFRPYVDPFRASETAMSIWTESWRAGMGVAFWWTEKWLEMPLAFMAWAPGGTAVRARGPGAAVIDLAQAAAARAAAEVADVASAAQEIVETAAEVPVVVTEDAVSVVEAAAETLKLEPDDLTRLVGIGPKLQIALAERGLTRFAQIAAWTEEDLASVDKALDLKGRAARDAWVAQAKRFAADS